MVFFKLYYIHAVAKLRLSNENFSSNLERIPKNTPQRFIYLA